VYDYDPTDMDRYIAGLLASGFMEETDSRYASDWVENVRSFSNSNCSLNIVFARGEGGIMRISESITDEWKSPFVQFNVDFARDPYVPGQRAAEDTELSNYAEFAERMGIPQDQRSPMDVLTDSQTDEYGRLYETIYYPSSWPRDVFGDLIPAYKGVGVMYYMVVTAPAANPSRDQALIASMYVAAYQPGDLERYVRELTAFGYREAPREEYSEQDILNSADDRYAYHVFTLPGVRCVVTAYDDDGLQMLQITVRWDGRYSNFFN